WALFRLLLTSGRLESLQRMTATEEGQRCRAISKESAVTWVELVRIQLSSWVFGLRQPRSPLHERLIRAFKNGSRTCGRRRKRLAIRPGTCERRDAGARIDYPLHSF